MTAAAPFGPQVPSPPGTLAGEVMHSTAYPGAGGGRFEGRRAVVVGSNTSAHDICQDLWEQAAISPRSPTTSA